MKSFGFFVILLFSSLAHGEPLDDCLSNVQNSPGTAYCYAKELERLDKVLNTAYRKALNKIDGLDLAPETRKGVRNRLVEAQRNWIRFRDSDCTAVSDSIDGTGAGIGGLECNIQLTTHRIEELSRWDRW